MSNRWDFEKHRLAHPFKSLNNCRTSGYLCDVGKKFYCNISFQCVLLFICVCVAVSAVQAVRSSCCTEGMFVDICTTVCFSQETNSKQAIWHQQKKKHSVRNSTSILKIYRQTECKSTFCLSDSSGAALLCYCLPLFQHLVSTFFLPNHLIQTEKR